MSQVLIDHLPYIDTDEPSEQMIQLSKTLIDKELTHMNPSNLHPNLPKPLSSSLSEPLDSWLTHVGTRTDSDPHHKYPRLDLDRYSSPLSSSSSSSPDLAQAYVALAYTQARRESLALAATHGKNQWLAGNATLERTLENVESAQREARARVELAQNARREAQNAARPTVEYLEDRWKNGIQNVVQVNVAALELKAQKKE
ncbi:uncharacterized protein SAPINGB_P000772 [Magnusiomyces paraingens]|uniref:Pre-mRNA-splicing factor SPF27 n=1 Tax=Magnusiomyces paraingens TaxID=2606893 RepID=A0A5E8B7B3_9ASCO|nr:uncharacterized protein SAPINGB_P000772 [Saprochaete ingens]VVT45504.1 unnamed protein product [Saprochaete ingens]